MFGRMFRRLVTGLRDPQVAASVLAVGASAIIAGVALLALKTGVEDRWAYWQIGVGVPVAIVGVVFLTIGPAEGRKKHNGTDQKVKQENVDNSPTFQAAAPVTVGGDLVVGTQHAPPRILQEADPTITIQADRRTAFLWVNNPGIEERFVVEISNFSKTYLMLRPKWNTGEATERKLMKGESDWLRVMVVEPEKPAPVLGEWVPSGYHARMQAWEARVDRRVRTVRFYDVQNDQDMEVPTNERFVFNVRVISSSRNPVSAQFAYGITESCLLVLPFDQQTMDTLNEEHKARLEEVEKMIEGWKFKAGSEEPSPDDEAEGA